MTISAHAIKGGYVVDNINDLIHNESVSGYNDYDPLPYISFDLEIPSVIITFGQADSSFRDWVQKEIFCIGGILDGMHNL